MQNYIYNIQTQAYDDSEDKLTQDAHTLNLWANQGWELVTVNGPVKCGSRGLAFIYYFRKLLEEGAENLILKDQSLALRGEYADKPQQS